MMKQDVSTTNHKTDNKNLETSTRYEFDKNSFIVTSVFKESGSETLGTVLMRLMKSAKDEKI